jgi:anaphase-promoting complex subunit 2
MIWASSTSANLNREFGQLFAESLQNSAEGEDAENEPWFACLQQLQWLQRGSFLAPILAKTLLTALQAHGHEIMDGDFERDDFLPEIQEWKDKTLVPWISAVVGNQHKNEWLSWLQELVLDCFVRCRMAEIFDLIADYPDSHPAVLEVGPLLTKTQLHADFCVALQQSLCRRLLHPGANTFQIIDVYINTIKVLRHVDPSDRLLQQVAEPVRTYLRGRPDTVRCIITNLTDQEADLYQELRRHDAKPLDDLDGQEEEDEEEEPGMNWMPAPPLSKQQAAFFDPTIGNARNNNNNNSLDILSILVSIYGSKELFVDEYRIMLADKLLANLDGNTDQEVHTLELLKLRFGDASMRQCEIMIKDTDDSKRIVTNIHSTLQTKEKNTVVDAAIISHIFWPSILQQDAIQHHARIQAELDAFSVEYGQLKNPRRLVWYNQLGTVELELDVLEDGVVKTKEVSCPPLQATLISYFEESSTRSVEELAQLIAIPEALVQKRMQFWLNHHVVVLLKPGIYQLASAQHWSDESDVVQDDDSPSGFGGNNEAEQDDVFSSYVVGMLKRYKELPLHRIHDMLKMFANSGGSDQAYNKTPRQLSALLQRLSRDGKLECGPTGMYKLVEK